MELRKVIAKAIGIAHNSSVGEMKKQYSNVSVCKKCKELDMRKMFYRFDEIAQYISEKPNYLLPFADTYYIAYTEIAGSRYIVIIGGNDDIVNMVATCRRLLTKTVNSILYNYLKVTSSLGLDSVIILYDHAHEIEDAVVEIFRW